MSKYMPLYSDIWDDCDFENYSAHKKLVYIFLTTNKKVEKSGIYKISIRQIAFHTNLTDDLINEIINELIDENKVGYDFEKSVIFIKNLFKYHKGIIKNKNILYLTMKRNYELVSTDFWNEFFQIYKEDKHIKFFIDEIINGSLMNHQLYININKNNNINNKQGNSNSRSRNLDSDQQEEKQGKEKMSIEKDFDDFWKSYLPIETKDKKSCKGYKEPARAAYIRARQQYDKDLIYGGAGRYLLNCRNNGIWSCHVSTFLEEKRFLDDYNEQTIKAVK